jgi:hypothetical protein
MAAAAAAQSEFTVTVNLSGVDQFNEIINLPSGPYKVKPTSFKPKVSKKAADAGGTTADNVWIGVQVLDGPEKGKTVEVILGLDMAEDYVRRAWQGLAYSMGASDEQAHSEKMTFSPTKVLKDKNGASRVLYIYVTPAPIVDGKPDYKKSYKNFISPAAYGEKLAALGEEAAAPAPKAPAKPKLAPAPEPEPVAAAPAAINPSNDIDL